MNTTSDALIHLDGVTKVFLTDEVETHALATINIENHRFVWRKLCSNMVCPLCDSAQGRTHLADVARPTSVFFCAMMLATGGG